MTSIDGIKNVQQQEGVTLGQGNANFEALVIRLWQAVSNESVLNLTALTAKKTFSALFISSTQAKKSSIGSFTISDIAHGKKIPSNEDISIIASLLPANYTPGELTKVIRREIEEKYPSCIIGDLILTTGETLSGVQLKKSMDYPEFLRSFEFEGSIMDCLIVPDSINSKDALELLRALDPELRLTLFPKKEDKLPSSTPDAKSLASQTRIISEEKKKERILTGLRQRISDRQEVSVKIISQALPPETKLIIHSITTNKTGLEMKTRLGVLTVDRIDKGPSPSEDTIEKIYVSCLKVFPHGAFDAIGIVGKYDLASSIHCTVTPTASGEPRVVIFKSFLTSLGEPPENLDPNKILTIRGVIDDTGFFTGFQQFRFSRI